MFVDSAFTAFVELKDVWLMQDQFGEKIKTEMNRIIGTLVTKKEVEVS